jgi:hypothetical protein
MRADAVRVFPCSPRSFHECGATRVVALLTEHAVVDKIIDHLKLKFAAEKPPPPAGAFQAPDMVADPPAEYFP